MSMLVFLVLVVVVLAIAFVGIDQQPTIQEPWKGILKALACAIAILVIVSRAGLL